MKFDVTLNTASLRDVPNLAEKMEGLGIDGTDDGALLGNEVGDTVGANDGDGLLQLVGILVGAAVDKILLGQAGIGTGAFVVVELGSRDGDEDKGRSVYLYDCTKGAMLGAACLYEGLRHDGGTLPRGTG